ncbi:hypothetical protein H5410_014073 [Solanum commersonii]|uniref:Uncharacterized protein n=1 Tax=Solanum commersonii TaxID=4109 RepID=A0A9J5ZPY5_SOLCO|nr:hypothetical protein H5410_014073 [Solanum commersonii]
MTVAATEPTLDNTVFARVIFDSADEEGMLLKGFLASERVTIFWMAKDDKRRQGSASPQGEASGEVLAFLKCGTI